MPEAAETPVQTALNLIITLKSEEDAKAVGELVAALNAMGPDNTVAQALMESNIVHFARFIPLNGGMQVAVLTEFDGTLEDYTKEFARLLGPVFDAVLEHAEDAPTLP